MNIYLRFIKAILNIPIKILDWKREMDDAGQSESLKQSNEEELLKKTVEL